MTSATRHDQSSVSLQPALSSGLTSMHANTRRPARVSLAFVLSCVVCLCSQRAFTGLVLFGHAFLAGGGNVVRTAVLEDFFGAVAFLTILRMN
jgi:hypothetical protein